MRPEIPVIWIYYEPYVLYTTPTNNASVQKLVMQDHKQKNTIPVPIETPKMVS